MNAMEMGAEVGPIHETRKRDPSAFTHHPAKVLSWLERTIDEAAMRPLVEQRA